MSAKPKTDARTAVASTVHPNNEPGITPLGLPAHCYRIAPELRARVELERAIEEFADRVVLAALVREALGIIERGKKT